MNLEWVVAVLVAWIAVGLGTAFVFGTFTRRNDVSDDVDELAPPIVKHLRPRKRTVQIGVRSHSKPDADKTTVAGPVERRVVKSA
jgi:hypothetical protein